MSMILYQSQSIFYTALNKRTNPIRVRLLGLNNNKLYVILFKNSFKTNT